MKIRLTRNEKHDLDLAIRLQAQDRAGLTPEVVVERIIAARLAPIDRLAHHHDAQSLINGCGLPDGRDAIGCRTCDWTDQIKAALEQPIRDGL